MSKTWVKFRDRYLPHPSLPALTFLITLSVRDSSTGGARTKKRLTETRFSSTKGVSMWCLMVDMMSLKSMAEMTPFFSLSFWANACRACSSCSSWAIKHDTTERKHKPIKGNAWNSTPAEAAAIYKHSVPARTGWTRGSWGLSYSLAQSANGWTRSPIWRGCGDELWSDWRCLAHFLQHKWK